MRRLIFLSLMLFGAVLHAQTTVTGKVVDENNEPIIGANVVLIDQPQIVIENGQFKNDGDFSAGKSTVHFKGIANTENSTIGGALQPSTSWRSKVEPGTGE